MAADQIIVTIVGLALIAGILWFFLLKRSAQAKAGGHVSILVDGGYSPNSIILEKGRETTLSFLRRDPSPCLEEVVLSDFGVKKFLPLNETVEIRIKPEQAGSYQFSCGMNMVHGRLEVK